MGAQWQCAVVMLAAVSFTLLESIGAEGRLLKQTATDPYLDIPLVDDELIVKFKPTANTDTKKGNALNKGNGKGQAKKVLKTGNGASTGDLVLVGVVDEKGSKPTKQKLKDFANSLKEDPEVEYAEPNFYLNSSQAVTNDEYYADLWGLLDGPAGANAKAAWAAGFQACEGIVVGVVDTGVQISHPDLNGSIWKNPGEIPGNGIDDDNNGRIDDVNGWDFQNNDKTPYDDPYDNHGTHVAGTIGATGNNGIGVTGVCQRGVKIIPAKFMGTSTSSGTIANAVAALWYLLDLKNRYDLNLVATSNSWGGGGFSQTMYEVISAHNSAGVLFIAAAGNSAGNNDAAPAYPASYDLPNIISVGAHAADGSAASFSNYGATSVDLFAPGVAIKSTYPVNSYTAIQGTSMATPHVTGAVALYAASYLKAYNSLPSASAIKSLLLSSGIQSSYYNNKCVSGRRLNIYNMLSTLPAPPAPSPSPSPPPPPPSSPPSSSPAPPTDSNPPSPPAEPPVIGPIPDRSPEPLVPLVPPTLPTPEAETPAPEPPTEDANDPRPRMRATVTTTVYFDGGSRGGAWFYCNAKVRAVAVDSGAPISGFTVDGHWGVSPDVNGYTDAKSEMGYAVSGNIGESNTRGSTDSPWIPTKGALVNWHPLFYSSSYPGTKCVFTLNSLTHVDYVLSSTSTMRAESALL